MARPNVGTLGVVTDPATTCNSRRAALQADALGLGDAGELVLFVACDLDSVLQPLLEILDLSLLPGELPLEFVDAGLGLFGTVDSIGDLTWPPRGKVIAAIPLGRAPSFLVTSPYRPQRTTKALAIRCVIVDMGLPPSMPIGVNSPTIEHIF